MRRSDLSIWIRHLNEPTLRALCACLIITLPLYLPFVFLAFCWYRREDILDSVKDLADIVLNGIEGG